MYMIYQYNKLKPPKFEGGPGPLRYAEWLRKLKNLFEIIDYPPKFKVALSTYQFQREVEFWWRAVKHRGDEHPVTWE